jgi:hypothetical protein
MGDARAEDPPAAMVDTGHANNFSQDMVCGTGIYSFYVEYVDYLYYLLSHATK